MSQHNTPENIDFALPPGYQAARQGAAMRVEDDRGRLVVAGADRAAYLQGMLTNDVLALRPGQGCYACYLTAQGRMISDLWVYELGDVMLMTMPAATRDTVLSRLDQFIFSEDVQLGDVTDTYGSVIALGPEAPLRLAGVIEDAAESVLAVLPEGGNLRVTVDGQPAIVLRPGDAGVPAYELLVSSAQVEATRERLLDAGAQLLSHEGAEALRIEGGIPRFHRDMDEDTIPLEANLESRAISVQKGCYVGQEVIIRVLHRGHGRVAKRLVGLAVDGAEVPAPGSPIRSGDRDIGRITSSVRSPQLQQPIALGYVHRDFVAPGTGVLIGGDTARVTATVTALPFVR